MKASAAGFAGRIHELETELAEKSAALDELEKKKQEEAENTAEDAAVYDKLSKRVDQIMEAANDGAHEILASALSRSDEIIAEAEKKAEKIRAEAAAQSEREKGIYQNTAVGYYDEVMHFASELRDSLNKLMEEISLKKAEVEDKLEDARASSQTESQTLSAKSEKKGSEKTPFSALEEKIERFFKNTLDAIGGMTGRKR